MIMPAAFVTVTISTAKWLMAAKIAMAAGPVFIAAQKVVDDVKRSKKKYYR